MLGILLRYLEACAFTTSQASTANHCTTIALTILGQHVAPMSNSTFCSAWATLFQYSVNVNHRVCVCVWSRIGEKLIVRYDNSSEYT